MWHETPLPIKSPMRPYGNQGFIITILMSCRPHFPSSRVACLYSDSTLAFGPMQSLIAALLVTISAGKDKALYLYELNPKTGGLIRVEHVLFGSSDDGRAWSAPRRLNLPVEATTDTPSQIIDLNSGRWFLA